MASVMAIISKEQFETIAQGTARDYGGVCFALWRYVSSHKALETLGEGGSLFLVTVRPNDKLLLVAILEKPTHDGKAWVSAKKNIVTSIPIGSLKARLKFENGKGISAKPGALAMSLQTPRRLTEEDERLLREAATGTATEPAKKKAKTPTKSPKSSSKKNKISEELTGLMESAFIEIENEYLDDLRDDPEAVLAAGDFSMTIQSIFNGSFDTAKDTLPLLEQLAPFADGRVITHRLAAEVQKGADATQLMNELVDAFAVSAINVFGTAIVALALDRPKQVPAAAQPFREHLAKHAEALKALLADD